MSEGIGIESGNRLNINLLLFLSAITFAVYFFASGNYGIFRDELYYFACGEHLDWGYVDHPPLVALYAAIIRPFFGDWLPGLRLPATLAISGAVFMAGMIARRLGGGSFAQGLAALFVMICPVYQGMSNFLSMNAFDILFWAALIYLIIVIAEKQEPKLWLIFGALAGLAVLNKYSALFLLAALAIAALFSKLRKQVASPWLWAGAVIAVLMVLPNVLWQNARGWPFLTWQASMTAENIAWITPLQFLKEQFLMMHPFAAPLWLAGLGYLLFAKRMQGKRFLAVAWIVALALFMLKGSKTYYPAPSYFLLFPAGAIAFEALFSRPKLGWAKPVLIVLLVAGGLLTLPYGLPVLPIDQFIAYDQVLKLEGDHATFENGRSIELRQHYADRFGWEDMTKEVARVYHSLSPAEQAKVAISGGNYGNAGAIDFWRDKYGLPRAISRHLTYWFWGTYDFSGDILITCGRHGKEELERLYESVQVAGQVHNDHALFYETDYPVYLCRGRRFEIGPLWRQAGMTN